MSVNKLVYIKIMDYKTIENPYTRIEVRFTFNPKVFGEMFNLGFKRNNTQNLFYKHFRGDEIKENVKVVLDYLTNEFGKHKIEHFKLIKTINNFTELDNVIGD